jgi:hypothetical protein
MIIIAILLVVLSLYVLVNSKGLFGIIMAILILLSACQFATMTL